MNPTRRSIRLCVILSVAIALIGTAVAVTTGREEPVTVSGRKVTPATEMLLNKWAQESRSDVGSLYAAVESESYRSSTYGCKMGWNPKYSLTPGEKVYAGVYEKVDWALSTIHCDHFLPNWSHPTRKVQDGWFEPAA